ncbi:hypothetical protein R1sor_015462 [Riccia sorocarpa]|uniref:Uncharacterized protein n=1 Tax=Riccia sorocarpa TaxID=122646 RepID=A0ABD3HCQ7_9MARC
MYASHHPHPTIVSQYGSHRGGVHAVRFRPQMKHLVSGGSDCAVYLWSLHCRPNLRHPVVRPYRFLGHTGPVYSVAVSPNDNLVASGSQDRSIRLWLPTVEGKSTAIKGHTGPVRTVNFNHDGRFLISGSDDKTIKLWKVNNQKFVFALSGHMNWVRSAEFNADARLILSGSDDKSIRLWDVEKHECIQQFQDVLGMVNSLRFHPDNSCVASGNSDHCIQIWDIRSKNLIQHYAANTGAVNSVCFHPSGNYLLSSCDDATLKIWDLREGQIVFTLQGHDGATQSAEFSASGEYFASGSSDEHVLLWRTNIDFAGCTPDKELVADEEVAHILCSACKCVCTHSSNEPAIHCPKRVKSFQTVAGKGASACKSSSLPPSKGADIPVDHPGELSEEITSKAKVHPINRRRSNTNNGKEGSLTARLKTSPVSSIPDVKSFESTLENICHQLSVLTRTVALFEERLSHSEKKLTRLEGIASQVTTDEESEEYRD